MPLTSYAPLCEAIVRLMAPLVEIVIHDLRKDQICFIQGGLSTRCVGDPSLLDMPFEQCIDEKIYSKLAFDGRLIKSISVPVAGPLLICINCDVSLFQQMSALAQAFVEKEPTNAQPASLFKNDWQERVHVVIHGFLQEKQWPFEKLSASQKKTVVRHLFETGAFQESKAADYLAKILSMGRATIFNYLKEWKKNESL